MNTSTLNWYIQKIRVSDHEDMRKNHIDLIGAQALLTVKRLDKSIQKMIEVQQSDEALPKDIIEAEKTKIDIYILQIRVLNSGTLNNLDDQTKLDKRLGNAPPREGKKRGDSTSKSTNKTKKLVLREDKSE